MNHYLSILIMINIYIILAASANLMVGMSNLLSLGQAAFYGIGAYVAAFALKPELHGIALLDFQIPLLPAIFLSMFVTSLIGAFIGWITLRLKGDYFVLATLGFQIITYSILYNWTDVTKGPAGIPGINAPKLLGVYEVSGIWSYLILSTALMVFTILIIYRILYSPNERKRAKQERIIKINQIKGIIISNIKPKAKIENIIRIINTSGNQNYSQLGNVFRAMRTNETALKTSGRNVTAFKILAFVISSAFTAVAGFIFATYISYIDPTSFNLDESIFILTALLIGGTGNLKGPVSGAVFVVVLPELLHFLSLPDEQAANLRMIIYGLVIILLMRLRPQGLMGKYKF